MLATLIDEPFDDEGWLFEIKWDGCRAIGKKNKNVQLVSRGEKSFNERFPDIVQDLEKLPGKFIVDGEIVILDKHGRSRFQLLQNYQKKKQGTPYYYLFDILSLNGQDLTHLPLTLRKKILKNLLEKKRSHLRYSDHIAKKGKALFQMAIKKRLEGIVAKKSDSPYQFKRRPVLARSCLKKK